MPFNTKEIRHAYKSKYNFTDGDKWHYLAVKKLSALLRGVTSKHDWDFFCLTCFDSYSTKYKFKNHYNICKDHNYCYSEIANEDNKILKYNHGEESMKFPFVIYADLEPLLIRIDTCYNNPEKSSATKINKHTPSFYSLFTDWSFDLTKNKLDCYRGRLYRKVF